MYIVVFAKRELGVKDWIISCLPRNTSTYISFLAHSNIYIKQWVWNQFNLIQRNKQLDFIKRWLKAKRLKVIYKIAMIWHLRWEVSNRDQTGKLLTCFKSLTFITSIYIFLGTTIKFVYTIVIMIRWWMHNARKLSENSDSKLINKRRFLVS